MRRAGAAVLVALGISCAPPEEHLVDSLPGGAGGVGLLNSRSRSSRPLIGGTVVVSADGKTAVVSDPERDLVSLVTLSRRTARTVRFSDGAQPTRATWNGDGLIQVVLRGTGALATLDPATAKVVSTQAVCPEPRGVAWDAERRATLVACASGELVTVRGAELEVRRYDAELRDVSVQGARVTLSTFRAPQVLEVGGATVTLPPIVADRPMVPTAAYRMLTTGSDKTIVVHQHAADDNVRQLPTVAPYYGNGNATPTCNTAVVRSAVTVLKGNTVVGSVQLPGVLPLDAALSPDGSELVVVHAGNSEVVRMPVANIEGGAPAACAPVSMTTPVDETGARIAPRGNPIGVAFTPSGDLLVHSREPAQLFVVSARTGSVVEIGLASSHVETPGQRLFHEGLGGISCASCHPEGQEDGHVWLLEGKKRRTQSLAGLNKTSPFHWDGSLPTLEDVVDETFVRRMGGTKPQPEVIDSLQAMLGTVRPPKAPTRAEPVDLPRGEAAFRKAGCASCHSGSQFTNDSTMDVGTGERLQVPSLLGVARRGPWMHDGCAKTMSERFSNPDCGGRQHGSVAMLSTAEQQDLIAWLGQL